MPHDETHPTMLRLEDREVPLEVSRHPQARRITVRVDGANGGIQLVLPRRAPLRHGLDFARGKAGWLLEQIDALPEPVRFAPGARIPILGIEHEIRHEQTARRGVWCEPGAILVSGRAEHLARRVTDFLKAEARRELSARARTKAEGIGRPLHRVSVRDMISRWGSCSSEGNMSFCWRLILAPEHVLDYVVAHEVAHLRHLHHGPRFWALTARLTEDVDAARVWLKAHGDSLWRYG